MTRKLATTIVTAATLAAAFIAGTAHASDPRDSPFPGDKYGYNFRTDARDVYGNGARVGRYDPYTDGAREVAPTTRDIENSRSLSGMDRRGVSAEPSRSFNVYTDGALAGMDRRGVSAEPSRSFDVYTDGSIA
ncbi:hypothetical protein LMG23992_01198 [Cupriavidus laharis]|uniref:Copper resistance protein CopQ n=1 Tax=Cupriavidus laharis TaxID=151654 RepID=A0ABN7Y5B9_9BURK|nr:hypothetical protein [Cupriavidus laharis]CAG9168574.1 hypothetical protein LMG23992_01198 [Cupriavidus laharis]